MGPGWGKVLGERVLAPPDSASVSPAHVATPLALPSLLLALITCVDF